MAKALPEQEECAPAGFVGATFANEELGKNIGGNAQGIGFEQVCTQHNW